MGSVLASGTCQRAALPPDDRERKGTRPGWTESDAVTARLRVARALLDLAQGFLLRRGGQGRRLRCSHARASQAGRRRVGTQASIGREQHFDLTNGCHSSSVEPRLGIGNGV